MQALSRGGALGAARESLPGSPGTGSPRWAGRSGRGQWGPARAGEGRDSAEVGLLSPFPLPAAPAVRTGEEFQGSSGPEVALGCVSAASSSNWNMIVWGSHWLLNFVNKQSPCAGAFALWSLYGSQFPMLAVSVG